MSALDHKAILSQIDSVLAERDVLLSNVDRAPNSVERYSQVIALLLAAINRLSPIGSTYMVNAKAYEKQYVGGRTAFMAIEPLTGILRALRSDYASGHLQSIVELVHADIFADFLDMAEYLLEQGYKDPAAVIVGSVLEEHLRKLCIKVGITILKADGTPRKADSLNSDLTPSVYSRLDQKNVTAWLDLRNNAAHGKYVEYTKEQVSLMLQSVRDFSARHPA